MFSVAARYTSARDGDRPPSESEMWPEGDIYLEEAKRLLDSSYSSSRPATCQALLLMGYREIGIGAMAQAWLYVGMAIRMAQDLGMHKSADQWMHGGTSLFTPIELQERRRVWYACVIMDKYVSSYIGRPLSIYERDFDTELPSIDEVRQFFRWKPYWPSTTRLARGGGGVATGEARPQRTGLCTISHSYPLMFQCLCRTLYACSSFAQVFDLIHFHSQYTQ